MAQPFLTPKSDHVKTQTNEKNTVTFNDRKDIIIEYLDYMNGVNKTNEKYTYQIYIFIFFRVQP